MLKIILSLVAILAVLIINELIWRAHKVSDEMSRKIVHISVAVFVAFWPYYMSYTEIQIIAVAFFLVVLMTRQLHVLKSIHKIHRKSAGDLFFPIAIFILATFNPEKAVFMIALLEIGLADGLAALVGEKWGKNNRYKVFGQTKSVIGTSFFIIVSYAILIIVKSTHPNQVLNLTGTTLILLPFVLALTENVAVLGSDDLLVPLVVLLILN